MIKSHEDSVKHGSSPDSLLAGLDVGRLAAKEYWVHGQCLRRWEHAAKRAEDAARRTCEEANLLAGEREKEGAVMDKVLTKFIPRLTNGGAVHCDLITTYYRECGGRWHMKNDWRLPPSVFLPAFVRAHPPTILCSPNGKPIFVSSLSHDDWVVALAQSDRDRAELNGELDGADDRGDDGDIVEDDQGEQELGVNAYGHDGAALLNDAAVLINKLARDRHTANVARRTVCM